MKISKTTHKLAAKLCLSIWDVDGVIQIRDGSGEPEPGFPTSVWTLYKVRDGEGLLWDGQLGGHCLTRHQANQMPLEIRDEKTFRKLLKAYRQVHLMRIAFYK